MQYPCLAGGIEDKKITAPEIESKLFLHIRPLNHEVCGAAKARKEHEAVGAMVHMGGEASVGRLIPDGGHRERLALSSFQLLYHSARC
eukprot:CAMPEP_0183290692 /NCGR_PEP_ID=MMETSP0160_2-20130417/328_1 /TAXON_ID=2839 ORGANISM="Odontella Sinensis, Strain Grunow 1884" /NCGR_SAMPLE_ID=MMETSP0160_2 /ASSEMBLY_ACC=CAM_ASM_000250 /LENGTH=87 /DNA_ID=CAMNT_0025451345 /DNA_START=533 /DNA_END=796 /DNA_ORIENTATION=-